MAQTRRMGKGNQRADRPKAPRFSPCYVHFLAGLAFLLLKLTRMGRIPNFTFRNRVFSVPSDQRRYLMVTGDRRLHLLRLTLSNLGQASMRFRSTEIISLAVVDPNFFQKLLDAL